MIERTIAVLMAVAALAACRGDHSEPARVRVGEVEIAASVSPPDLRVGKNELRIDLEDAQGHPIADADVQVEVTMAAMGAMPAMGGAATVEPMGGGRYKAAFDLEMGGTWQVAVRAKPKSGAMAKAEGSLTVGTPGLRLEGAGAAAHAAMEPAPMESAQDGEHPAEFRIDPARLRQVGIRSEPARRESMDQGVRAVGRVTWDETALHDVTVRVAGVAGEVVADALGVPVEKGQVLFQLYSPDLYAAQREYLEALRARGAARGTSAPQRGDAMVAAAERRLQLWGIDAADVAAIARRGTAQEYLPVRAPASGYVIEKDIVAGSAVEMGQRVYRIAPLDRVWIDAELYEAELARVAVGQSADVTLSYLPGQNFQAKVAFVYPSVQSDRRTGRVRFELANPDRALRPDMFATVHLRASMGERLSVPDTAVLRAGERDFVFVDLGGGRLRPQRVETGTTSASGSG